jgi:hypothetical protein
VESPHRLSIQSIEPGAIELLAVWSRFTEEEIQELGRAGLDGPGPVLDAGMRIPPSFSNAVN